MKKFIVISVICFVVFLGLLNGIHHIYVANADTMAGQYMVAALVAVMWASLFASLASLAYPFLRRHLVISSQ
ncbi:hypothetical protein L1D40_03950 [Shewanella insulae]|uniref:hypothetical protein n=1 Tax=Shewanella insulae TaxID=2681496 RepID=UPI001EFE163E|nr:hypothetical protein [Shewanella insulae]MCG9754380.1 hypothetical protein [Shewanella insulae]